MLPQFDSISTLGEQPICHLTSSYFVATRRCLASRVIGCSTFEEAISLLKSRKVDATLVAGAYPRIRDFIMDSSLVCTNAFVETIPQLVVAASAVEPLPVSAERVYLHPATIPLLPEVKVSFDEAVETSSTSAAAMSASTDLKSMAICNALASEYYGLRTLQVLRKGIRMPFVLFALSG